MSKYRIEFKGLTYALRLIEFGEGWGNYFVASTQLLRLLLNADCSYTSPEARYVDEEIFYFIPTHYFRLNDIELRKKILDEL